MKHVATSTTTRYGIAAAVLFLCALIVRGIAYPVITSDFVYFLNPWFIALRSHEGLTAFALPFSDYAPLYLYIVKGATYLPVPSLYSIKTISVICDELLAMLTYLILSYAKPDWPVAKRLFGAALMFAAPTILINSSLWGQADAVYAAAVLGSFYAMLRDRPLWACAAFALALSFKLQAIFFVPILLGYLLPRGKDLAYLVLIPLLYTASILPAVLGGGSFSYWFSIYTKQSTEYTGLSVSAQSIFAFATHLPLSAHVQGVLGMAGIAAAAIVAAGLIVWAARTQPLTTRTALLFSLLSTTALPYLLPRMHERYFFLADLFALLYAVYTPKRWFIAPLVIGSSLLSYLPYLSQLGFAWMHIDLRIPSVLLALAIGFLVFDLRKETRNFRSA